MSTIQPSVNSTVTLIPDNTIAGNYGLFGVYFNDTYIWLTSPSNKKIYKYNILNKTYTTISFSFVYAARITYDGSDLWISSHYNMWYMNSPTCYFAKLNPTTNTFTEYKFNTLSGTGGATTPFIISNGTFVWVHYHNYLNKFNISSLTTNTTVTQTPVLSYDLHALHILANPSGSSMTRAQYFGNGMIYDGNNIWVCNTNSYNNTLLILNNNSNTTIASKIMDDSTNCMTKDPITSTIYCYKRGNNGVIGCYQNISNVITLVKSINLLTNHNVGFLMICDSSFIWMSAGNGEVYRISTSVNSNIQLLVTGGDTQGLYSNGTNVYCTFGNGFYKTEIDPPIIIPNNHPSITYSIACFLKGSKILTDKGYCNVEDLHKNDLIQTSRDGLKKIHLIGKREIIHPCSNDRDKNQLYKCSKKQYPELFDDLIMTGCHSILVDNDEVSEVTKEKIKEVHEHLFVTDAKLRLPLCADERSIVYEKAGECSIYHLALENDDELMNYGIYANGLLVESCSKIYLENYNLSKLTLI